MPPGKQSKLSKFFGVLEERLEEKEKESAPKRRKIDEDTYKEARLEEGLPYVPNGHRDKFGNMRKRVGGRPRKADKDKAGVAGGATSNVKRFGDQRRRELSAPDALILITELEKQYNERFSQWEDKPTTAEVNAFYYEMACERPSLKLGINGAKTLRGIVMKRQMYELRVACLNLGTGHGRSKGNKGHRKVSNLRHSLTNMGVRAAGGGRTDHFDEFLQLVKIYTDVESLRGHHLKPDDVFREFKDQVQKK